MKLINLTAIAVLVLIFAGCGSDRVDIPACSSDPNGGITLKLSEAGYYPPSSWSSVSGNSISGTVSTAGAPWQVNASWDGLNIISGATYSFVAPVCISTPGSLTFTVTLKNATYDLMAPEVMSVPCDGTAHGVSLLATASSANAQVAVNYGGAVGTYVLSSNATFTRMK